MKAQRLVKALQKAGFEVNEANEVKGEKYLLSFSVQDGNAICVHARRYNDVSDSMTDYHAGFFIQTIKRAVEVVATKKGA